MGITLYKSARLSNGMLLACFAPEELRGMKTEFTERDPGGIPSRIGVSPDVFHSWEKKLRQTLQVRERAFVALQKVWVDTHLEELTGGNLPAFEKQ